MNDFIGKLNLEDFKYKVTVWYKNEKFHAIVTEPKSNSRFHGICLNNTFTEISWGDVFEAEVLGDIIVLTKKLADNSGKYKLEGVDLDKFSNFDIRSIMPELWNKDNIPEFLFKLSYSYKDGLWYKFCGQYCLIANLDLIRSIMGKDKDGTPLIWASFEMNKLDTKYDFISQFCIEESRLLRMPVNHVNDAFFMLNEFDNMNYEFYKRKMYDSSYKMMFQVGILFLKHFFSKEDCPFKFEINDNQISRFLNTWKKIEPDIENIFKENNNENMLDEFNMLWLYMLNNKPIIDLNLTPDFVQSFLKSVQMQTVVLYSN